MIMIMSGLGRKDLYKSLSPVSDTVELAIWRNS